MAFVPTTVQFQGRWELKDGGNLATWCGSSLHFRTHSTSVCLELGNLTSPRHPTRKLNVLCNFGSSFEPRIIPVRGPRKLILQPGGGAETDGTIHDVTLMLCDWGASLHVLNIHATDDSPILAPASTLPVKPLLFIGASLVSGFSPPFRKELVLPRGAFQAFPSVVAHQLRARGLNVHLEMVAYPGLRLMTAPLAAGMEEVFWDGMEGVGGWDARAKDSAENIFICLGTNDQGWGEDSDTFSSHYKAFLLRLRDSYKGICKHIFVISPFGAYRDNESPTFRRTVYEPGVQNMVEALAQTWALSDPEGTKLYHISTENWIDKTLTCDGLHPTVEGHEKIGMKLIEFMDSGGFLKH